MEIRKEDLKGITRLTESLIKKTQLDVKKINKSIEALEAKRFKMMKAMNEEIETNKAKSTLYWKSIEELVKVETGYELNGEQINHIFNGGVVVIEKEENSTEQETNGNTGDGFPHMDINTSSLY